MKKPAAPVAKSKSSTRFNEMREMANQASANAPTITDRLAFASSVLSNHPLGMSAPATGVPVAEHQPAHPPASTTAVPEHTATPVAHVGNPRGKFEMVPLHLIVPNPFNARRTYRESRVKEMKSSLAEHGQETPGTATIREGKYVLGAGHYRLKGLQLLDAQEMALMVIPGLTDKQLYELSYRENAEREEQTAFDNALAWRDLLDRGIYLSEQELAEAVGLSAPNVNKTLSLLRLSEPVLNLVRESPTTFALGVLYELSLFEPIGGVDKTLDLARAAGAGEIGRKQIQDTRSALQVAKPRKGRESSRAYKLAVAGAAEGVLKEWPSGKVVFEVNIVDPELREQFVNELRTRFTPKE
jgi:ParB family chromosome partitioning protein